MQESIERLLALSLVHWFCCIEAATAHSLYFFPKEASLIKRNKKELTLIKQKKQESKIGVQEKQSEKEPLIT